MAVIGLLAVAAVALIAGLGPALASPGERWPQPITPVTLTALHNLEELRSAVRESFEGRGEYPVEISPEDESMVLYDEVYISGY